MPRCQGFMLTLLAVAHLLTGSPVLAQVGGPPDVIGNPPPKDKCNVVGDIVIGPPDPGTPGPFTVVFAEYDSGDTTANIPDFDDPVEFLARYSYPEELECGPFPIVFIMHGGHKTCFDQDHNLHFGWPCPDGQLPVPSYR